MHAYHYSFPIVLFYSDEITSCLNGKMNRSHFMQVKKSQLPFLPNVKECYVIYETFDLIISVSTKINVKFIFYLCGNFKCVTYIIEMTENAGTHFSISARLPFYFINTFER